MSYRAFWQRRCRAAAAGAALKPSGGNCAVLPLLFCHKHQACAAGAGVRGNDGAKAGNAPAGHVQVFVHVMVEGGQYTFFVRIQQSVPVPRVHSAHLFNVLKHCHKRAGAAAGRVRQLDLPIHDRKHRLDTQGTAHQRHRGGQNARPCAGASGCPLRPERGCAA